MKSLQQRLIELDNRDADAAIIELRRLTAEIKANNKTYRMAQDRANNDIEILTADNKIYRQAIDKTANDLQFTCKPSYEIADELCDLLDSVSTLRCPKDG